MELCRRFYHADAARLLACGRSQAPRAGGGRRARANGTALKKENSTASARAKRRAVLREFRHRKLKNRSGEVTTDPGAALSAALHASGQPNAEFLRRREHSGLGGKHKPRQKESKRSPGKRR